MNCDKTVTTSLSYVVFLFASEMCLVYLRLSDVIPAVNSSERPSRLLVLTHSSMLLGVIALVASIRKYGLQLSSMDRIELHPRNLFHQGL